jgi:hypothetical protein
MSAHENVVGLTSLARHADLRQAQYYHGLLDELRTNSALELADCQNALDQRRESGALSTTRAQVLIAAKQAELTALNHMIDALSERFPTAGDFFPDDEALPAALSM